MRNCTSSYEGTGANSVYFSKVLSFNLITLGSAVTYTVVHKGISTTQLSIHCNTTAHSRQPRVQHFACNFQRLVNFLGVLPMDLFAGGANLIQQELLVQPSGSTRNFRWYWKDEVDALTLAAGCPDKTSRTESPWQHLVSGVKVNPLLISVHTIQCRWQYRNKWKYIQKTKQR